MTVSQYLNTDFTTISIKENIENIKELLIQHDCLIVLDENGQATGLLSCNGLIAGAMTAGDCAYIKTSVSPDEKLLDVLNLMQQAGHERLLVKEDGKLLGLVKLSTIVFPLAEMVKKYQLLFQHVTHDLRNPLGNITGILTLMEHC